MATVVGLSDVSRAVGTLAVANGGSGVASVTSNVILKGNGTGAMTESGISDDGTTILLNNRDVFRVNGTVQSRVLMIDQGSASNAKIWEINHDGNAFSVRTRTDADGTGIDFINVAQSGTAIGAVTIRNSLASSAFTIQGTGTVTLQSTTGTSDVQSSTGTFQTVTSNSGAIFRRNTSYGAVPFQAFSQRQVSTTDATVTTLWTYATATDSITYIEGVVIGRRTGGVSGAANDSAVYKVIAAFRNTAGTVTQLGTTTVQFTNEAQAGWDGVFAISGVNINFNITGAASNNIRWDAHLTATPSS
jgi:hypothetical protein